MTTVEIVKPSAAALPEYAAALKTGWSPDNVRGNVAAKEHLTRIDKAPSAFLAALDDPEARGEPISLPDGSFAPRLPGFVRWIWDGAFCGSIGFRWQYGTAALPAHVLGHIGFSIIPSKRGFGYAKQALRLLLPMARQIGLPYVELTADPDNLASQKVIQSCNGSLVERFRKTEAYGGAESLRFRIRLDEF